MSTVPSVVSVPGWTSAGFTGSDAYRILEPTTTTPQRWRRDRHHKTAEIAFKRIFNLLAPAFSAINLTRAPNGRHTLAPLHAGIAGEPLVINAIREKYGIEVAPGHLTANPRFPAMASAPDGFVSVEAIEAIYARDPRIPRFPIGSIAWPVEIKCMDDNRLRNFDANGSSEKIRWQIMCHIISSGTASDYPMGGLIIAAPRNSQPTASNICGRIHVAKKSVLCRTAHRIREFVSDVEEITNTLLELCDLPPTQIILPPDTHVYEVREACSSVVVGLVNNGASARQIIDSYPDVVTPYERAAMVALMNRFAPTGSMTDLWRGFEDAILRIAESATWFNAPRTFTTGANALLFGRSA